MLAVLFTILKIVACAVSCALGYDVGVMFSLLASNRKKTGRPVNLEEATRLVEILIRLFVQNTLLISVSIIFYLLLFR